jgi:hypothetical protein
MGSNRKLLRGDEETYDLVQNIEVLTPTVIQE